MKKILCSILPILAIALVIAMVSGVASAQTFSDVFSTNYFANATTGGSPDATLRFTEDGSIAQTECAMIYVYAADQQLTTCCGCPVTANGLVHESVKVDLLSNFLSRQEPNEGTIQIVSGLPVGGVCDPTSVEIAPEIESWATHVQNKIGTAFPITESKGDEELLDPPQLALYEDDCASAIRLGSGFGVCHCNPEALK